MTAQDLKSLWFPVAASSDLPAHHVYQGQLLGQEFAVWRADDGSVNVWENRCLHRGVRLSIGLNLGTELKCQYHGWRYASGTASCLYIPAHPANAPARTIRNRVYPAAERFGLVWSSLDPESDAPPLPDADETKTLALRAMPINAPAPLVIEALEKYTFLPTGASDDTPSTAEASRAGDLAIKITCEAGPHATTALFFVQPTSATTSTIRGLLLEQVDTAARIETLRRHNCALEALRQLVEQQAATTDLSASAITEAEIPLSPQVTTIPGAERAAHGEVIRVRLDRKWQVAEDVVALRLVPVEGALPSAFPGSHIDVHLPNGLVRQYSLVNAPSDHDAYIIGVKREPQSAGGSSTVHDVVREGDVLAVSPPRDNFPPARRADEHILIAGGIGMTPLLAMAKALSTQRRRFRLHVFARTDAHVPFASDLAALAENVEQHIGLDAAATAARITELLGTRTGDAHVYICGPAPMLRAARDIAEAAGWPDNAVHFEYFANDQATNDSSTFDVALARSAITVAIPAGRTITDVLREHGVSIPTSCEQGACGTCLTTVLEGEPDHQDVYLSKAERASNTCMTPCISRSKSPRLVLDL
ncbi:Rieske 2Fe-2S domain-containing protein [Hyphomicrobium sp. CS1GBMeth3]|uniref:Rieske 2Fe-2S domain-containing protein n=1 Tax=Hyphomicrobium sp. CS1GBMeth3 TaxID=1892845 RepID=UPI0009319828|nr:Rieske 2Fe-2S domain-containing protein [Hyphomicrobium sp. CS1GBMeth3]